MGGRGELGSRGAIADGERGGRSPHSLNAGSTTGRAASRLVRSIPEPSAQGRTRVSVFANGATRGGRTRLSVAAARKWVKDNGLVKESSKRVRHKDGSSSVKTLYKGRGGTSATVTTVSKPKKSG